MKKGWFSELKHISLRESTTWFDQPEIYIPSLPPLPLSLFLSQNSPDRVLILYLDKIFLSSLRAKQCNHPVFVNRTETEFYPWRRITEHEDGKMSLPLSLSFHRVRYLCDGKEDSHRKTRLDVSFFLKGRIEPWMMLVMVSKGSKMDREG